MTREQAETTFNGICTGILVGVWVLLSGVLGASWWMGALGGLIGSALFTGCFRDTEKRETTFMGHTFDKKSVK